MPDTIDESKKKILIIEDDILVATDLQSRLTALGYAICGKAGSVDKALELITSGRPDLIMMNLTMANGRDGMGALKIMGGQLNIPVVFITAYPDRHLLEPTELTHPVGYVLKPFNDRELRTALEMVLYAARVDAQRRKTEEELENTKKQLELIIDNNPGLLAFVNDKEEFLFVNQAYADWYGLPREEIAGKKVHELIPPYTYEVAQEKIRRVLNGETLRYENVFPMDDGLKKTVVAQYVPQYDDQKRVVAFLATVEDISDRKRSEEALREKEVFLETLVNAIPVPVFFKDQEGRYSGYNKAFNVFFGETIHRFLGKTVSDVAAPEVTKIHEEKDRQLFQNGEAQKYEDKIKNGNGDMRDVIFNKTAITDMEGKVKGLIGTILDITDLKEMEAESKTREKFLNRVIDQSPFAIWISDDQGTLLRANPALKKFLNVTDGQIVGLYNVLKDPVLEKQGLIPLIRTVYEEGKTINFTCDWDGRDIPTMDLGEVNSVSIAATIFPIHNPEGKLTNVVLNWIDITERKRAEEALKESEERYRLLFEKSPLGIMHFSPDGIIVDFNENFINIIGSPREKLLGLNLFEAMADGPARKALKEALTYGTSMFEGKYQTLTGNKEIFVKAIYKRLTDQNGETLGAIGIFEDVSVKMELESKLRQAQKMEAVGTLAGGVAHDFNNLLQAINGFTEVILMDMTTKDQNYNNLKAIERAGARAAELVRQLLLFSRKAETKRKFLNLNQEIDHAQKILHRTIPKMIEIEMRLDDHLWNINADPVQIEQILLNLGINAADAMPEGGKFLIETQNAIIEQDQTRNLPDAAPGRYALLTVSDAGHGMDETTVSKVFEPFYTTKGIGKGTGLGLASVYGIIKSHGGFITCYSEIGQGTTFRLYFPAMDENDTPEERENRIDSPQGGTETILIVDDEETIRDFVAQILKRYGYTVMTAASGEEALEIHAQKSGGIDLTIMDLGMPGMGGHRCLQELIKNNEKEKVLIASGYSSSGQAKKTLEAGAAGYVAKPYNLMEFLEKVRAILDK